MPAINYDYGRDFYIWRDGQRLRTRMIRTIEPSEVETNAAFERRIDALAAALERREGTLGVEYAFERRNGIIVLCTIDVSQEPCPVTVIEDDRLAGGRPDGPRGQRGRGNN